MDDVQQTARIIRRRKNVMRAWKMLRVALLTLIGLLCTGVMIFPLYWVVISSLKFTPELFARIPTFFPQQLNWTPYINNFLHNQDMLRYMGNSLQIATGTMLLSLVLAAP